MLKRIIGTSLAQNLDLRPNSNEIASLATRRSCEPTLHHACCEGVNSSKTQQRKLRQVLKCADPLPHNPNSHHSSQTGYWLRILESRNGSELKCLKTMGACDG
eukprot:1717829-Amphidinium_carterae.1